MMVGMCKITLRLPENQTLKGKRQVVRSIISTVRNKFNVSISEVEDNSLWQLVTLGIACVSNDSRHANEVLSRVVDYIQRASSDADMVDYELEVMPGL